MFLSRQQACAFKRLHFNNCIYSPSVCLLHFSSSHPFHSYTVGNVISRGKDQCKYLYFPLPDRIRLSSFHLGSFPLCVPCFWLLFRRAYACGLSTAMLSRGVCMKEPPPPPMCVLNREGWNCPWENLRSTPNSGAVWRYLHCLPVLHRESPWLKVSCPALGYSGLMFSAGLPAFKCSVASPLLSPQGRWESSCAV